LDDRFNVNDHPEEVRGGIEQKFSFIFEYFMINWDDSGWFCEYLTKYDFDFVNWRFETIEQAEEQIYGGLA
jgi:hypothetical protein